MDKKSHRLNSGPSRFGGSRVGGIADGVLRVRVSRHFRQRRTTRFAGVRTATVPRGWLYLDTWLLGI